MPELLTPLGTASIVFVCTFGAAGLGMLLHKKLPDDQLNGDTRDVIKLVMGLVATMAALVLSLLIASANTSYEAQSGELQQMTAIIAELDGILAQYGPAADESRRKLRAAVSSGIDKIWPKDGLQAVEITPTTRFAETEEFYDCVARLSGDTDTQKYFKTRALEMIGDIHKTRALMLEQISNSLPWPFLTVLVFWATMLFMGFGLLSRVNATVMAAVMIGALSVSSAIFLILELNHPYRGLMGISDAPLRNALVKIER